MSAALVEVIEADVIISNNTIELCVPPGTEWESKDERRRAAFSLFLLGVDPDADLFHIRRGEEISVNYALPAVAKLYTEFCEVYDRNI